jgi:DNA-binding response OmpR family regulator
MTRILVIDDEEDLVWAISYALKDEGYEIVTAGDGAEGIAAAYRAQPDLVILDIVMPVVDGIQVCATLRRDPNLAVVPILFLTRRSSIEDRINGLNDGADDYLIKPFDIGELKARVGALLRRAGRRAASPERLTQLVYRDLSLDLRTHQVTIGGRGVLLTPAEFDLLRHLLMHQGQVFSSEQLLTQVWRYPADTREHGLVRWHVMNLRAKIEPEAGRPVYLRTVPRHGYILGDSDSVLNR